ncbi:unnamed protein product [Dovyalis caffra]|uniref:NADH dehydrogenase subunit 6 n=1 Tax=Dovyalis caffra TaxID=77055 RepID=A0AAV1RWV4_9ROSI|nr:unnamed protein product [Dovyalis caffra]
MTDLNPTSKLSCGIKPNVILDGRGGAASGGGLCWIYGGDGWHGNLSFGELGWGWWYSLWMFTAGFVVTLASNHVIDGDREQIAGSSWLGLVEV